LSDLATVNVVGAVSGMCRAALRDVVRDQKQGVIVLLWALRERIQVISYKALSENGVF